MWVSDAVNGINPEQAFEQSNVYGMANVVDERSKRSPCPRRNTLGEVAERLRKDIPGIGGRELLQTLYALGSYEWYRHTFYEKALTWCVAAQATNKTDEVEFFRRAILEVYDRDRAARAVDKHKLPTAVRIDKMQKSVMYEKGKYDLQWTTMYWTNDTPHQVITTVGEIRQQTPPDEFKIANYVQNVYQGQRRRQIIYARYGSWYVEVARRNEDVRYG
jgi:hypothetical protein